MVPSNTYLGHRIGAERIHSLLEKVEVITSAPRTTCVTELKAYLTVFAPLYKLLQKYYVRRWKKEQEKTRGAYKFCEITLFAESARTSVCILQLTVLLLCCWH